MQGPEGNLIFDHTGIVASLARAAAPRSISRRR